MQDEDVKDSKITAKVRVEMKFNTGNYESETYEVVVEGPYNDVKEGKDLVRLLYPVIKNAKTTIKKAKDGASIEEVMPKVDEKKDIVVPPPPPPAAEVKKPNKKDDI